MDFIKNFMELTRAYSLLMTFASCMVIFSYANYSENFSFINFLFIVIGLSCVQMGANLYDDYIDIKNITKNGIMLKDVKFNAYIPKARLILNETFSLKQVRYIINILFSIALAIGIGFTLLSGWKVLIFALAGGLLTLFYPISSRYYLAEIIVGLIFGPLMIMGGYFALTGEFNFSLFILSWVIFFSTLVLLHTHNLMDWEFDIANNKNTLCILSKSKQNAIKILMAFISICYVIILLGVASGNFNPNTLYVFLTLPIATKLLESIKDYINIVDVKYETRWYYGFFENWENIKNNHIDFFMYRFYLARNFGFFFALFLAIGTIR